ncbi:MAG: hypothetical protein QOC69_6380, partial [Mycobacterium sp.]|nr:hypothetical protein [Mycobacterium sp.]
MLIESTVFLGVGFPRWDGPGLA